MKQRIGLVLFLLLAVTALGAAETVAPMAPLTDMEHLENTGVYARIAGFDPEARTISVTLLEVERYAAEDAENLSAGDVLVTGGEEISVSKAEQDFGIVRVNDGEWEAVEGGVYLVQDGGFSSAETLGTYAAYEYDCPVFMELGTLTLAVPDTMLFLDACETMGGAESLPTVYSADAFLEKLELAEAGEIIDPGFATDNLYLVFGNGGELAVIYRYYVPWQ